MHSTCPAMMLQDDGSPDLFSEDMFELRLTETNTTSGLDRFIPIKVEANLYSILEQIEVKDKSISKKESQPNDDIDDLNLSLRRRESLE